MVRATDVSIPHSEFCSFGRAKRDGVSSSSTVSIPHSEFCSFGPCRRGSRFSRSARFQFPIRNSVRSDFASDRGGDSQNFVSIPHSEFCSFGQPGFFVINNNKACFNSPFGILFVRTLCRPSRCRSSPGFNSPFGILFVRTLYDSDQCQS